MMFARSVPLSRCVDRPSSIVVNLLSPRGVDPSKYMATEHETHVSWLDVLSEETHLIDRRRSEFFRRRCAHSIGLAVRLIGLTVDRTNSAPFGSIDSMLVALSHSVLEIMYILLARILLSRRLLILPATKDTRSAKTGKDGTLHSTHQPPSTELTLSLLRRLTKTGIRGI